MKSFALNIFRFLKLSYSFVTIHGRYIVYVFSSVPFKKLELSNPPTYNNSKTDSTANISFACFQNFKIGLRSSVVESFFPKVTETQGFCNSVQKSNTCMVCSEK